MGGEAARVASLLGFDLMPWQRFCFDTALELDEHGRLVYRQVVITLPRQSGKSIALLTAIIHRLTFMAERLYPVLQEMRRPDLIQQAYYSAQTGSAARTKLKEEWHPMIERSPMGRLLTQFRQSIGSELLRFGNVSGPCGTLAILSMMASSGHGNVTDMGMIDEAWIDTDDRREQALLPGMNTRPSPQLWLVSTAGTEQSIYLRRKVDMGRLQVEQGIDESVAYFEWSAPDDVDPDDEDVWRACMPALGLSTPIEAVRAARLGMDEDEFRRAYLNQWVRTDARIIPYDRWLRCQVDSGGPREPLTFAVDANPMRSRSSLAVSDGDTVEVIRVYEDGLDRMIEDTIKVAGAGGMVAVDKISPASSKIPLLERAGVRVVEMNYGDVKKAAGEMFDAIVNLGVAVVPNKALTAAVEGARKKMSGDQFSWDRRSPDADITPLNAVTFARAAAVSRRKGQVWGPF